MNLEEQIGKIVEANGASLYDIETVTEFDEKIYRISITNRLICVLISPVSSPLSLMSIHQCMGSIAWRSALLGSNGN